MEQVALFSRLDFYFNPERKIDRIAYTLPNGQTITGPVFSDVQCTSCFDSDGYYYVKTKNSFSTTGRFSPYLEGVHHWKAKSGDIVIYSGEFNAVNSGKGSDFVKVSPDKRYFCYNNNTVFVPIGLNIAGPDYDLPEGLNFTDYNEDYPTTGISSFKRRLCALAENGGNYIRISLADPMFNFRTENNKTYKHAAFYNLDRVLNLCRELGIKVTVTLDSFKTFKNDYSTPPHECRKIRDSLSGRYLTDVAAFLSDERLINRWLTEVKEYLVRLWNDPVIFAFELWNEIDRIDAPFNTVLDFAKKVIPQIKRLSPLNMVTVSLSPYNSEDKKELFELASKLGELSFLQVHSFLDTKALIPCCTESPVIMAQNAVNTFKTKNMPLLISATGAVNGYNKKPFRYYSTDYNGIIFNDCTFVPFFCGAAGTGIMEHVSEYIEPQNLYSCYKPFCEMLHNVKVHTQHFKPMEIIRKKAFVFVLKGRSTTLLYVRSKADNWQNVMRDNCSPFYIKGLSLPSFSGKKAKLFPIMGDSSNTSEIELNSDSFIVPPFTHGFFIKIR